MSNFTTQSKSCQTVFFISFIFSVLFISGCAVEAAKTEDKIAADKKNNQTQTAKPENGEPKNLIKIETNSPGDTVRVFYKNLREKRFREALFLTNLRPAIEGLTENELKDLQVDFEHLAVQVPAEIEINGEIVAGNSATVTAKLPDIETDKIDLQEIRLRRENGVWTILTVDEKAEKVVRKEGRNYFFTLRVETHHEEAKAMLNRVVKAQMVYASQNNNLYGEMPVLIEKGFLPEDILTPESTGYVYKIGLSADKKKYAATAEPAVHGKTGKLSFLLESNGEKTPRLTSRETSGKSLKDVNKM